MSDATLCKAVCAVDNLNSNNKCLNNDILHHFSNSREVGQREYIYINIYYIIYYIYIFFFSSFMFLFFILRIE